MTAAEIRGGTELPARRELIELVTDDHLRLVGELASPVAEQPVATLVCLHPLPTAGGFMDSHLLRKAAARLPALASLAVLRFNSRGTSSPRGRSEGSFGDGITERADLAAAMALVSERSLPRPWLLGWSFGTEIILKWGRQHPIEGAILLSPPLHRTSAAEVAAWAAPASPRLVALIPEFDDYLRPPAASAAFASVPDTELVMVDGAKHLWVGEFYSRRVLSEIVARLNPTALPLPTSWPPSGRPPAS